MCCYICPPNPKFPEFTTIILSCCCIWLTLKGDDAKLYIYCCYWPPLFLAGFIPWISVELPVRSLPCCPPLPYPALRPLGTKGVTDVVVLPVYVLVVPAIFWAKVLCAFSSLLLPLTILVAFAAPLAWAPRGFSLTVPLAFLVLLLFDLTMLEFCCFLAAAVAFYSSSVVCKMYINFDGSKSVSISPTRFLSSL